MTTWRDLEGIMLNEISQRKTPYYLTYLWNLKQNSQIQRTNDVDGCQKGTSLQLSDK